MNRSGAPRGAWTVTQVASLLLAVCCARGAHAQSAGDTSPATPRLRRTPWHVTDLPGWPCWLHLEATHRTRFERLANDFRVGLPGDAMAVALRTTLAAELRFAPVFLGAEMLDARVYLASDSPPPDTTLVDAFEPLQAYVGLRLAHLLWPDDEASVRVGRVTLDLGSRRLVARNSFRNTINAFTGLDLHWRSPTGDDVRLFATLPLRRLPETPAALTHSRVQLDRETLGSIFWGGHFTSGEGARGVRLETFAYGLRERDEPEVATRDRRLFTPGLRIHRAAHPGRLDAELESVLQVGTSRATARPDDTQDLRHLALFAHASVGHTLEMAWRPRLALQFDYASGDRTPNDRTNGRFDALFGARRFELGPTGMYGAFARSNILTPGGRVEVQPHALLDGFFAYRAFWLAQARDAWTTAGVRDPTGQSGRFVGHQVEARVRLRLFGGTLTLEVGAAHTFLGAFARNAPNATSQGDPTYVYTQIEVGL